MCVVDGAALSIACDASARVHARSSLELSSRTPSLCQTACRLPHDRLTCTRTAGELHGGGRSSVRQRPFSYCSCVLVACMSTSCQSTHDTHPHRHTHRLTHTCSHRHTHTGTHGTNLDRHGALSIVPTRRVHSLAPSSHVWGS